MASPDKERRKPDATPQTPGGMLEREYGHSSGDRNTRTDEHDWKYFKDRKDGGVEERVDHVDAEREPSSDPHRRQ